MEANFAAALKHVLAMEGGYVDDPSDHGGATNLGITKATLSHWRGRPVTDEEVRTVTSDEARAIYHSNYWSPIRGDYLPSGLDMMVFDISVNSGPRRAAKMLQEVVGVEPDGMLGPVTMGALRGKDTRELLASLARIRRVFYRMICDRDPSQERFLKGWLNRVDATLVRARAIT